MDNDAIQFQQSTGPRPPSKREVLWNELEWLHQQLGIEPPTTTYTLEALEEELTVARRAYHAFAAQQASALWSKLHQTTPASDPLKVDVAFLLAAQQVGATLEGTFGERILDAQQEAAYRRTHKTWRNFYGPLFFDEQPTPESYRSTPSQNRAGAGDTNGE